MSALPEIAIPSFQDSNPINYQGEKGIIILGKTFTEKGSTVIKIARYVVLLELLIFSLLIFSL